jgi:two-component sensor histidine kinase
LRPHEDRGEGNVRRFSVTGCDMEISDSVISSLALILHEFATNSAKYGALSATAGEIQIHCADQVGNVAITWSERGGPPVAPPVGNEGFGNFLVRNAVTRQLGGEVSWNLETRGSGHPLIPAAGPPKRLSEVRIKTPGEGQRGAQVRPSQCKN